MSLLKQILKSQIGRPISCICVQKQQIHTFICQHRVCNQKHQLKQRQDTNTTQSFHCGHVRNAPILSDPENKGQRQKGINFDTLGSWNNRLDFSISLEKSIEKGKLIPEIPLDDIGRASLIGRRKVNEDRYVIEQLTDNILYFGVFDGHGGSTAVEFVHQYLGHYLRQRLRESKNLFEVLTNSFIDVNNVLARHIMYYATGKYILTILKRLTETKDLFKVLTDSFIDVNNVLTRHFIHYATAESDFMTGTTATVCLLRDNIELVIGHVGDTRAILCREGEAIRLSHDHHPDDVNEAERIKSVGGKITENSFGVAHVNGRLNMTRSIGDFDLKSYGVTAAPFCRSIEVRHGKDTFLVLTTDGLSFVLSDQELMDIINSCNTPEDAAYCITDQALQFGSEDNVTAVVIPFGAWGKYTDSTRSIPYSFGRNFFSNRY